MKKICFVIIFCLITMVGLSYAEIIYVVWNHTGFENGSIEYPYNTIQEGILALRDVGDVGGEVMVAAGIYSPSTNGENFPIVIPATTIDGVHLINGIKLIGAGADVCILEAQAESGSKRVIRFDGGASSTKVEGFTIRHSSLSNGGGILCKPGTSPIITKNIITGNNSSGGSGGGISCLNSSPTITDNTITGNHTDFSGGGISCYKDSSYPEEDCSPIIMLNDITGNTATLGGGGIACESNSSPTINNNIITGNNANIYQNYQWLGGGGILCNSSSPTITNNLISGNNAYNNSGDPWANISGGGILCAQSFDSTITIVNNIITDNNAFPSGGGISSHNSTPDIINNTIANNTAWGNGGGINCRGFDGYSSSPIIKNNIITGNTVSVGHGSGINCEGSSPDNDYNNVWYADYYGCVPGPDDISFDPLFVDPDNGNYQLESDSLCIDAGDNNALNIPDPDITDDFDGKDRIVDGNYDGVKGVDMGAYEFDPQNNRPAAMDDSYSVDEDVALTIDEIDGVLENDSDDDEGDTLTAVLDENVSHGTLELNPDGSFTYEPEENFNGTDTFTYMANDGQADSNITTVTITVNPVNDLPVAYDQSITTDEDTEISITLTATDDDDDDSLTYSVVTGPLNGVLSGNPPDLTYTPDLNYFGVDSLTFKAEDGQPDSVDVATVSITINPVNDPPEANAGPDQTVAANDKCEAEVTLNGMGSSDIDGDELTYTWDGPFGQASGAQPTVTLGKGTHEITLTVDDGKGGTATDTVQITVEDQTPPVISLSDSVYVSVEKEKGKGRKKKKWEKVNKLTVSATDNCSSDVEIFIDNVEIFNKKGRPDKGKGVYYIIDGNDIYVFPKKKKWIIRVTVTATDGVNSVTETISKTLLKYKGWSWKSFYKPLFWRCFH